MYRINRELYYERLNILVCVNFALKVEWTKDKIFQFLKEFGYKYQGTNKTKIQKENEFIETEEFVKEYKNGRYHIFVAFGRKSSGTEHYPILKIFAHFDKYLKKDNQILHVSGGFDNYDMGEMYHIHYKLKAANLGEIDYKDRFAWHATLNKSIKKKFKRALNKDYSKYDIGKYKKIIGTYQYTIQIIYQYKYMHIVCVSAYTESQRHKLNKIKAKKEFERIISLLY